MNTANINSNLCGVILAGGSGTRFWPLSRSQYPKQILRLFGSESMLQFTIERLLHRIQPDRLGIVLNSSQEDVIRLDLNRMGWHTIKLWLEPLSRNTAPAIALAAAMLGNQTDSEVMGVFPADHYIGDQKQFLEALDQGAVLAQAGYLVTFGISPARPETGYGYIKAGKALQYHDFGFAVSQFIEKPDLDRAQSFLAEGGYFWNSGIFMFRRDVLLHAYAQHLPELYENFTPLFGGENGTSLKAIYEKLPSIAIDHGIMEKANNVAVLPVDMGWNDVGSWGALFELFPQDEHGNVIVGRVHKKECQNSLVMSQKRLVATIGLKDTIVVDTADATLVCHREKVQDVKDLVSELNKENLMETVLHPTVERPWGSYTIIDSGPCFQVKQIVVAPEKRLSLQLHRYRAEHWVVVQGTALVTVGSEIKEVVSNESIYIPIETPHRLENPGSEPLRIIEVQTGSYLGEDDIVRLDDDFWRKSITLDYSGVNTH